MREAPRRVSAQQARVPAPLWSRAFGGGVLLLLLLFGFCLLEVILGRVHVLLVLYLRLGQVGALAMQQVHVGHGFKVIWVLVYLVPFLDFRNAFLVFPLVL